MGHAPRQKDKCRTEISTYPHFATVQYLVFCLQTSVPFTIEERSRHLNEPKQHVNVHPFQVRRNYPHQAETLETILVNDQPFQDITAPTHTAHPRYSLGLLPHFLPTSWPSVQSCSPSCRNIPHIFVGCDGFLTSLDEACATLLYLRAFSISLYNMNITASV